MKVPSSVVLLTILDLHFPKDYHINLYIHLLSHMNRLDHHHHLHPQLQPQLAYLMYFNILHCPQLPTLRYHMIRPAHVEAIILLSNQQRPCTLINYYSKGTMVFGDLSNINIMQIKLLLYPIHIYNAYPYQIHPRRTNLSTPLNPGKQQPFVSCTKLTCRLFQFILL